MAKYIAPMEPILLIVQKGMGSSPYAPASTAFGASSYLLQACLSVSRGYDGIEELFKKMSNITVRLKEYEYGAIESSLKKKLIDIIAYFLEIFGKAGACIRKRRIKQWARSVFLQEDCISARVNKLQNYVETELSLVIALTYGRVKDVQNTVNATQTDIKVVKASIDQILMNQHRDRQRVFTKDEEDSLLKSLRTETTDEIAQVHAASVEKLTHGTGLWIRDDVMFQAWEQEKAPILWILGNPGVGKTMLAARTIETLRNKYTQHSDIPSLTSVSYPYFKENNPALKDSARMWKAAALQMTKANDRFKKYAVAKIAKQSEDTFSSARRIWQQLFWTFSLKKRHPSLLRALLLLSSTGLMKLPQQNESSFWIA